MAKDLHIYADEIYDGTVEENEYGICVHPKNGQPSASPSRKSNTKRYEFFINNKHAAARNLPRRVCSFLI